MYGQWGRGGGGVHGGGSGGGIVGGRGGGGDKCVGSDGGGGGSGGGRGGGSGGSPWSDQQWVRLVRRIMQWVRLVQRRGGKRGYKRRGIAGIQSLAATDDQINETWRDVHLERARAARREARCLESYPEHADGLSDWCIATQISCEVNEELACIYDARETAAHGDGGSYGPACHNVDQSPVHMNEAGSVSLKTLALVGTRTVPLIENHGTTRARWSGRSL